VKNIRDAIGKKIHDRIHENPMDVLKYAVGYHPRNRVTSRTKTILKREADHMPDVKEAVKAEMMDRAAAVERRELKRFIILLHAVAVAPLLDVLLVGSPVLSTMSIGLIAYEYIIRDKETIA
jgi:hypothetical protein